MCKQSTNNTISIFIFSQAYFEVPKGTNRALRSICHVFKPNNFREVQNFYQDKTSLDMTLNEFNLLKTNCWNEKYKLLIIDMTKGNYTGCYR